MPVYATKPEADAAQSFHMEQIKRHLSVWICNLPDARRIVWLKKFRERQGDDVADEITDRAREVYRAHRRTGGNNA